MIVQAQQECNGTEMMKEWITRTTEGTESYRENDGQGVHNKVVAMMESQIKEPDPKPQQESETGLTPNTEQDHSREDVSAHVLEAQEKLNK